MALLNRLSTPFSHFLSPVGREFMLDTRTFSVILLSFNCNAFALHLVFYYSTSTLREPAMKAQENNRKRVRGRNDMKNKKENESFYLFLLVKVVIGLYNSATRCRQQLHHSIAVPYGLMPAAVVPVRYRRRRTASPGRKNRTLAKTF